jgi:uncharacterized protein (TIGR02147 family)
MQLEKPKKIPETFVDILKTEFQKKSLNNAYYSLRAFARDLNLTSGHLSEILNFKSGLSDKKAIAISKVLFSNEEDQKLFLNLVKISNSAAEEKERLEKELYNYDSSYLKISDDYYHVLTEWYYFALVELVKVVDFKNDDEWIANRLKIPVASVKPAIERLIRVELLELVDGNLIQTYDYFVSPSGTPSDTAKKFHKQLLNKAILAVDEQKIEERNFTSGFLRVRKEDLPKAALKIKEFRREFAKEIEEGEGHDSIYGLTIQLFRADCDFVVE